MNTHKIKFPSGNTASELLHYMGEDHIEQRPEVAQRLFAKCFPGKTAELLDDELDQLIKDVATALDVKKDHIGEEWTALQQYNLERYHQRLAAMR